VSEKGLMSCRFRPVTSLCWGLCAAVVLGMAGACSPEYHKQDADEEVYKIIDSKWQDSFGQKVNYTITDSYILSSPNDIQVEKAIPSSGIITLAQAVAMATAHNRDYQGQKEELYLTALVLTGQRHKYTQQWFGTIDGEYAKGVDQTGETYEDVSVDAGLATGRTHLLADGVMITTALAIDWARFLAGDPRTSLRSVLSASLAAPLLGAGAGKLALEELTQAERNVLYKIRSFNRYRKTFVVDIVSKYYGVLQQRDAVTNAENNYKRVAESKERLEMEAQAGRRNRMDVDEARQNVLRAEDKLVRARESYKHTLDAFKLQLSLPTDADVELDQNELKALEEIGVSKFDYTSDAAIETALLQRLDLANSIDKIDDALRNAILAADGLGPQLNLSGSTDINSREKTDFSRLQFHQGTYELGFDADLPFDRKTQRNAYRRALITLQQQQRLYEDDTEKIKLAVRRAYRQLQKTADQYEIQKSSLALAEQRVESNRLLLDAGRATVRVLLDSQDALLDAQNNLTSALVSHLNARLSFFRDVGILQVRPDGMWQH